MPHRLSTDWLQMPHVCPGALNHKPPRSDSPDKKHELHNTITQSTTTLPFIHTTNSPQITNHHRLTTKVRSSIEKCNCSVVLAVLVVL